MADRDPPRSILLAGGGTGGHIYPNVAIAERIRGLAPSTRIHYLVSDRPGDARILDELGASYTASPARPLPSLRRPWQAVSFLKAWRASIRQAEDLLREHEVQAVVATGGFVTGPAIVAARKLGLERVLVNLDAVPGQANRRLASLCTQRFSAYATPAIPDATRVGLPLRIVSVGAANPQASRASLGLDPHRPTLFVTGATHGAESIITTMMHLVSLPRYRGSFEGWQVFHQCGTYDVARLQEAYDAAGIAAKVVDYCDTMGAAWRSADVALSRAGAGSVAEAWANATPTVFMPNPYHADQHQRHNAQPLAAVGGAVILTDHVDDARNCDSLGPTLGALMSDEARRSDMRRVLETTRPPDGAQAIAQWLVGERSDARAERLGA